MKQLVSIIIPAYNAEEWIEETIESALAQTWPRKEIIIVDDGSTDKTFSIAKKYESTMLKTIHQINGGVSRARNIGLNMAQGDYIQWLDADDVLAEDKIEKQLEIIEGDGYGVLASGKFGTFYYRIEKAVFKETQLWRNLTPIDWILTRFTENCWMQISSWLISRKLTNIAGPWNEKLSLDEDGEYLCRVVSLSEGIKFADEAKSYYRVGNLESLCMNRSKYSLDSSLLSMELSFIVARSMEDSERVRNACLKFLHHRMRDYFAINPEIAEKVEKLASALGGNIIGPEMSWRFCVIKNILGWSKTMQLKHIKRKMSLLALKTIDKMICEINKQKDNEP